MLLTRELYVRYVKRDGVEVVWTLGKSIPAQLDAIDPETICLELFAHCRVTEEAPSRAVLYANVGKIRLARYWFGTRTGNATDLVNWGATNQVREKSEIGQWVETSQGWKAVEEGDIVLIKQHQSQQ